MKEYFPTLSESAWRWVRFLGIVALAVVTIYLVLALQTVFTPLVIGLTLAYILNPVVKLLERRGLTRTWAVTVVFLAAAAVLITAGIFLAVLVYNQTVRFVDALPEYVAQSRAWLVTTFPNLEEQLTAPNALDGEAAAPPWTSWLREQMPLAAEGVTGVTAVFAMLMSALSAAILIPMYAFFFLLQFDPMIRSIRDHLPAAWRPTIVHVVTLIDAKTADFFRGRVIVCLIVGVLTGVGWQFVGVPYALLFGLAVAVLNLVPFLPIVVLPPVLLLTYVDAGDGWVVTVSLAMGVFVVVQAIESFALYPYFSAKTSGIHPVTSIVALLIGAEVAGVLGMLLSIPVASTLKSLGTTYVYPEIRRLANQPEPRTKTPVP